MTMDRLAIRGRRQSATSPSLPAVRKTPATTRHWAPTCRRARRPRRMRRREIRYAERGGEKVYGMSSVTAMKKHSGGAAHYRAAEGKTVETPLRTGRGAMMTYIGAAHPRRSQSAPPSCA